MQFQPGNTIGNRFLPGQSGNPAGREPRALKIIRELKPEYKALTREQITEIYLLVLDMGIDEIKRIGRDKESNYPAIIVAACRFIEKDCARGYGTGIEQLLNRAHGKANQPITGADGKALVPFAFNITPIAGDEEDNATAQDISKELERLQRPDGKRDSESGRDTEREDVQHNADAMDYSGEVSDNDNRSQ